MRSLQRKKSPTAFLYKGIFLKMKTAVTLLSLAAGASAFTSVQPSSRSTAVNAAMDKWSGAMDLRGKEFKFDPVRTLIKLYLRKAIPPSYHPFSIFAFSFFLVVYCS